MKQSPDEIRLLARKLYEAGQKEKRKTPYAWGIDAERTWDDLPGESIAVWDAVALCALREMVKE